MEGSWRRNLLVLWIGVFFCSTAYSIVIPFLPLFLRDELGVHEHVEAWSGVVFGISFLASALIAPFWGSLADKYGRKPMLLRSGLSLAMLYFVTYFVHHPVELMAVRICQGLLAGYVPSAIAMVGTNTPENKVGYALGVMATSNAVGSIVGPMLGGFVSSWVGNREAFLVAGGVVFLSFVIAWAFAKEENFKPAAKRSGVINDIRELSHNKLLMSVLVIVSIVSASVMIVEPLLTLYVLELGVSGSDAKVTAGIIFSAVGVATALAAPQWGELGTKFGYGRILMIGLIGGGVGNLLQLVFHHYVAFGVLRFSYGLFFAGVYPALNALIVQTTAPEYRGRAFGLNQSFNQLGIMIGPMLGGFLGGFVSIPFVFALNGAALIAIALIIRTRRIDEAAARLHGSQ
ncbi:MFS transporter [Paenibacillus chartarius]|uniref:MFS transporter n=1 Tax=Paenibacillus chartarius TaxID=747481 RepID=A0ABV6DEU8_9BACL